MNLRMDKKRTFSTSCTSTKDKRGSMLKRHRVNKVAENKNFQQSYIPVWEGSGGKEELQKEGNDDKLGHKK